MFARKEREKNEKMMMSLKNTIIIGYKNDQIKRISSERLRKPFTSSFPVGFGS
jgi:hypothetical protein